MCFTMDGGGGGSIPSGLEHCNLHMKTNGGQEIIANYNTRGRTDKSGGVRWVESVIFQKRELFFSIL